MGAKTNIKDPRFVIEHARDPECSLLTPSSDSQVLFLANILSKMEAAPPRSAIDHARREIAILQEYRTRLIAGMVTGKHDVRAVAAHLPDEHEEAEA